MVLSVGEFGDEVKILHEHHISTYGLVGNKETIDLLHTNDPLHSDLSRNPTKRSSNSLVPTHGVSVLEAKLQQYPSLTRSNTYTLLS